MPVCSLTCPSVRRLERPPEAALRPPRAPPRLAAAAFAGFAAGFAADFEPGLRPRLAAGAAAGAAALRPRPRLADAAGRADEASLRGRPRRPAFSTRSCSK